MKPTVLRRSGMRVRASLVLAAALATVGPARANGPDSQASAPAVDGCAEAVAERVQKRYETIRDLEARFRQRTRAAAFGGVAADPLVASGRVVFAKPGRMRWSYEEPEPSLVVSDGEGVWIYDPKAREAQHLPLGERFLSGAAIQFLLGQGDLLAEFQVSASACDASPVRLMLRPRRDASYERLEVAVDPKTGEIRESVVVDLLGNVTTVRFEDVRTNREPDPALFRFEPEEGVRVLELAPAP